MRRPSTQNYRVATNVVTHSKPLERALHRAAGLPPMSTGTYPVNDVVAHFRALRKSQMGLARLCATDDARRTYVDLAFAASWQVRAQKAKARNEGMRFGHYKQIEVSPGVWKLAVAEAA